MSTYVVESPVTKRCPFRDEVDYGRIRLTFRAAMPELHWLRQQVDAFAGSLLSHEQMTDRLSEILAEYDVEIVLTWRTAGWEVTCSCATSPTPPARP